MSKDAAIGAILRRFRGAFVSAAIFSLFANLLLLTIPLYLINVFTHVFASFSTDTLLLLTLVAVGALLLQAGLDVIRSGLLTRASAGAENLLGEQALAASLHQAAGSNQHSAQAMRDVSELRTLIGGREVFRLVELPLIPVFVGVIYLFHPVLAMISLGGAIVLFGLALLNEVVTRRALREANQESLRGFNRVEDYMRNSDAIVCMGMVSGITSRWQADNAPRLGHLTSAQERAGVLGATARFVRMLLQVAMLGTGAYLYLHHEIVPAAIWAGSVLMARALSPVESIIGTWRNVVSGKAAYQRLAALLRTQPAGEQQTVLPVPRGELAVQRAAVVVPPEGRVLLRGVSLNLAAGEMLGVVGPSGAGKSTLGKLVVGVLPPTAGSVRLDGSELTHWNPETLGRHLGYLPQDVQLFSGTVAENIGRMHGAEASEDVIAAAQLVGVHELIQRLPQGYDTVIGEGGVALSAGQKQQIGLARAYFLRPGLVVLDEPNSNLDAEGETALLKTLQEGKQLGITQIVISHRPSMLQAADKMLWLQEGKVKRFGPAGEVMGLVTGGRSAQAPQERSGRAGTVHVVSQVGSGAAAESSRS